MLNWLRRWKVSPSAIIALAALLLYIIPSVVLNAYIERQRQQAYDKHYESMAMDAANRTADELDYRIELYEVLIKGVAFNEELSNHLLRKYEDAVSQWEAVNYFESSYKYVLGVLPGITQFRIYHMNETLLENGGVLWKPGDRILDDENERDWYARKVNLDKVEWSVQYYPRSPESYSVLTNNIPRGSLRSVGVLHLRFTNNAAFGSALEPTNDTGTAHALVANDGKVLLATDSALVGDALGDTPFGLAEQYGGNDSQAFIVRDESGFYICNTVRNGWKLYSYVPMNNLAKDLDQVNAFYGFGLVVVMTLGVCAVLLILSYYRTRLSRLNKRIQQDVPDNLPALPQMVLTDHVAQVEAHYGSMVKRMKDLKLREMEEAMRAMESYVNPHFLYNTLGLIRWRALDDGDEELCSLVDDMTMYYRLSLSGGRSVVTVSDELAHLQSYVDIQQLRWGDRVSVEYDIDSAILEAYTPKNILQTIVENCYVHSLVPGRSDHVIRIIAKQENANITFVVSDNGMGIEPDKLAYLNREDDMEISGIGIRSVRQRLKMYFGNNMTMQLSSEMGKGTSVLIRIPYCSQEPTIIGG